MHSTLIKSNYELAGYFQTEIKEAHAEAEIPGSVVVEILHSGPMLPVIFLNPPKPNCLFWSANKNKHWR